ncbi:YhjD/YihY/BrkB family envelope integrity protein [Bacillus licheniformis]|nr:YhjD/YihY/BrkB family envelope integrity protein [Bacillus licheniformis]
MSVIEETLNTGNRGLLSFGIIAALWSASNGLNAIVRAFNHAYEVEETALYHGSADIAPLTAAMVSQYWSRFFCLYSGGPSAIYRQSGRYAGDVSDGMVSASLGNQPACAADRLYGFVLFAPNKRLSFKFVLPGAVAATAGWILVSVLFSYYVSEFANYSATYGSLGGIIVLMIWFI